MVTLVIAEMVRTTTDTVSGEMTDMMLMVRDCTVDLHPVAAVVITDTMLRTLDIFKVHPVILLKVSPDPGIDSEVAIVAVGEGDDHHRLDTIHRHHHLLRRWPQRRGSNI